MSSDKKGKLSPLFADKANHKKITGPFSGVVFGAGFIAATAAAMVAPFTPYPSLPPGFGAGITDLLKPHSLTEEQAQQVLVRVMDDMLDPRRFDDEQQAAARAHIRSGIGDLSGLKKSLLPKQGEKTPVEEVTERVTAMIESPVFTQLMNEHSAVWREQQSILHGRQVAAALTTAQVQAKAPPRASFTRNRNTVTA